MGNLSDLCIAKPWLSPLGPLLENTEYPGLGRLPLDSPVPLRMSRGRQALVQIVAQDPVSPSAGSAALQVSQLGLHTAECFPGATFRLLSDSSGCRCVDFGVPQKVLKNQKVLDGENASMVRFFSYKKAERHRKLAGAENDPNCFPLIEDDRRLLPLDEQHLVHPAHTQVTTINQAKAGQGVHQGRIPRNGLVAQDIVRCNPAGGVPRDY